MNIQRKILAGYWSSTLLQLKYECKDNTILKNFKQRNYSKK